MRIKQKFILLMLLIGLVPTLVVSVVAYITISRELTAKTITQVDSLAIKQERKINSLLQNKKEGLIKIANQYTLQTDLTAYIAGNTTTAKQLNANLYARELDDSSIVGIYLTDVHGKTIASAATTPDGSPESVQKALGYAPPAQPGVIFSLQEDKRDGLNKLFISTTITINQKTAGVLTDVVRLDDLLAAVEDYTGLGTTGETIIAAKQGKTYVSLFPLRFDTNAALKRDVGSLLLAGTKDRTYQNITDYRGEKVIASVKNMPVTNWTLITKLNQDEALHPIKLLRNSLLLIMLASSVFIIGASLYFARLLTKPIITLTEKARLISGGDFSQRIVVAGKDEISTLATTFNAMADQLAKFYGALERKVAERTQSLNQKVQELAAAKAKDDAILSSIGEGLVVTDKNGSILLANQLGLQLMQLGTQVAAGTSIDVWQMYDEKNVSLPAEQRPVQLALSTRQKVSRDIVTATPEGAKRTLGVTATPVLQNGDLIGAIQIIRDKTKEKEIDRMKTEFISLASHQLRTPLSAIRWFSEMLISGDAGELNQQQSEFAHNVYSSTERMIQLVSSLLNISRIESGRIRIDPKPTNIRELVNGIVNDLKGKTEERQQTIVISVHDDLPAVNLDARLIGQVYLNLLTNAIKYSPKGGEITVFVSRKDNELVSQVTDSGYGIPLAEQPKVFQKFFRATNVAKVETDGTGLGMYLVKSIIESSGGKIWFKSEENKGTTFWFSLPMSGMKPKEGEVTID